MTDIPGEKLILSKIYKDLGITIYTCVECGIYVTCTTGYNECVKENSGCGALYCDECFENIDNGDYVCWSGGVNCYFRYCPKCDNGVGCHYKDCSPQM